MYIFDLDGTLTDSNGLWLEVDDEFLGRRGLTTTDEYRDMVGSAIFPTAAEYTREYYHLEDDPEDIMAEWEGLAEHHYRELVHLKEGAEEYLRLCRGLGRKTALFTACRPNLCRAVLERFGLADCFDHIVFAEEIGLEKHDPRCFAELARRIGAEAEQCVLFDDSPSTCATAREAGMTVVGVLDEFYAHRREELEKVCHRCVRSLMELEEEPLQSSRSCDRIIANNAKKELEVIP